MKITNYTVLAGLEAPRKIALIADLHSKPCEKLMWVLREVKPDYIMIAGDLVNRKIENSRYAESFLALCADLAPTFYALGNHEWQYNAEDARSMRASGAFFLDNTFVHIDGLCVGGLTSGFKGRRHEHANGVGVPELGWLADFEAEPGYKILLCHHPEYYPQYLRGRKIDLMLSGHAHGGQIRLFNHGLYAPGQGILPKYTAGIHEGRLIISTGLANTGGIIPRINNETELVVIKLI